MRDSHLGAETVRRAGHVAYHTNKTHRPEIEKLQLDPALVTLGSEIRSSSFHGLRNDRRTEPVRHVGEAGTTLRQRPQPAGRRAEQASADRVGPEAPGDQTQP